MCLIRTSAAGPHSTAPVQVASGSPPPPTLHHLLGVCDRHGSSVAAPHIGGIPPAAAAVAARDALLALLEGRHRSAIMIDRIPPAGGKAIMLLAAAWTLCSRHHPREPADTSPYVHIQCLVMSQRPTPTGNPCLHASFQKENRTLAMWPVLRRSAPDYLTLVRGAIPNLATQPRRPNNLVEPAI